MTKADEILAATLNLLGTPEGDEPAEIATMLGHLHELAVESHQTDDQRPGSGRKAQEI